MAALAAMTDALHHAQVIANARDVAHDLGAVADQAGATYRLTQPATFDEIGFFDLEVEVALGDIDGAAADARDIEASFDSGDDLVGVVLALQPCQ